MISATESYSERNLSVISFPNSSTMTHWEFRFRLGIGQLRISASRYVHSFGPLMIYSFPVILSLMKRLITPYSGLLGCCAGIYEMDGLPATRKEAEAANPRRMKIANVA